MPVSTFPSVGFRCSQKARALLLPQPSLRRYRQQPLHPPYLRNLLQRLFTLCLLHNIIDYHLCYPPSHLFLSLPQKKHPKTQITSSSWNKNTALSITHRLSFRDVVNLHKSVTCSKHILPWWKCPCFQSTPLTSTIVFMSQCTFHET